MKRLIRKASTNLYHGTCVEYLRNITNDGVLTPNASQGAGKNRNRDGSQFGGFGFLATNPEVALNFANYIPPQQTEAHVVIEMILDEANLLPDNDDDPNSTTWQESAASVQQVKIDGEVQTGVFSQVYFYDRDTSELMFQSDFASWMQVYENNRQQFDLEIE